MCNKALLFALAGSVMLGLVGSACGGQIPVAPLKYNHGIKKLKSSMPALPLIFERNIGQAPPAVKFLSHGNDSLLLITSDEAVLRISGSASESVQKRSIILAPRTTTAMRLVGANPDAFVEGRGQLAARINYFIGRDPSRWHTNVPAVGAVLVHEAWSGVDVEYRRDPEQSSGAVECTFTVRPGIDPSIIRLAFDGIDRIRVLSGGGLSFQSGKREIRFTKLYVFEEGDGGRHEVAARFVVASGGRAHADPSESLVQFQVSRRDQRARLVIDPTLIYSTVMGGSGETSGGADSYGTGDSANAIALDTAGNESDRNSHLGRFSQHQQQIREWLPLRPVV
jgi:hypothetical protein